MHLFHASPLEVEVDVHYALLCRTLEAQQIERLVVTTGGDDPPRAA